MQINPGLQRTASRPLTIGLVVLMAAVALLLGGAAGYWARSLTPAPVPAVNATSTQQAPGGSSPNGSDEQFRQRLIQANS
jgi:uncharacterized membrane protein